MRKTKIGIRKYVAFSAAGILFSLAAIAPRAQPTVRVAKSYEDTVRILVVTNQTASGGGNCSPATIPVGPKTLEFVKQSLAGVPNVKYAESRSTSWATVTAAFAPRMPHVIVHINAGFYSESAGMDAILDQAANQLIGVVSIGDDAAAFADNVFGFTNVSNADPVMDDAIKFSRLWLELDAKLDTLQEPGVVRNTVEALKADTLFFKPFGTDPSGDYRCQADADIYNVDPAYASKVSFLGFQGASDGGKPVGSRRQWQVITTFQSLQRRGVALAYQPQFLANAKAAHQIDYDAIMFASFAHAYRDPKLHFTDAAGNHLPAAGYWSPDQGKVYLEYIDDFAGPDLSKTFTFSIRNRNGTSPSDSETVSVRVQAAQSGGKGLWKAEIPLVELKSALRLNGAANTNVLGEITAKVNGHNDVGMPDGTSATATLKVAYPDLPAAVKITDAAQPASTVGRFTTSLIIQVQDQSFTRFAGDTVWARVACAGSGDAIAKLALVEQAPGTYLSSPVAKAEGTGSPADAVLACAGSDKITVAYIDEVYGTGGGTEVAWVVDASAVMDYAALDGTAIITAIKDGAGANAFVVVVKGPTPTVGASDVLTVTLTTPSPSQDTEAIPLRETSPTSGIFISAPIPFAFASGALPGNGKVEVVPDPADPLKAVTLSGTAVLGSVTLKKELAISPSAGSLRFTAVDTSVILATIKEGPPDSVFRLVARGASPTAAVDALTLTLTAGADKETLVLTETAAGSGIFLSQPIRFSFAQAALPGNGALEAVPDAKDYGLPVTAQAAAVLNGVSLRSELAIEPSPNPVRSAYMRDEDGDGAADHAYFSFIRPLWTLPSTLGPVYWNEVGQAFANPRPPRIAFVDGSGQTQVVADFSEAPFRAGLTSIPGGAFPFAKFPQDAVFGGQVPVLADSMGPVLVNASIAPYDGDAGLPGTGLDTLVLTVSEALRPADWARMARFGEARDGRCGGYPESQPVVPAGAPALDGGRLSYTFLIASDLGPKTPFTGDCVYLNADGTYADVPGNRPPENGIRIEGPRTRKSVLTLGGYPAVAGTSRNETGVVTWIPPVGYRPGEKFLEPVLPIPGSAVVGADGTGPQPLPADVGTLRVVTNRKYIARARIFDHFGNYVTELAQSFGYRGEMANPARAAGRGWTSFLVWDLKDAKGLKVGQGAYIWKTDLYFEDGVHENRVVRTGVLRSR